jgi:hypothetical protein
MSAGKSAPGQPNISDVVRSPARWRDLLTHWAWPVEDYMRSGGATVLS